MTRKQPALAAALFASALALAGCGKAEAPTPTAANDSAAPSEAASESTANGANMAMQALPTDAWTGRWLGPEGMFLDIAKDAANGAGHYKIVNQYSLDDKAEFGGIADGSTIRFVRNGKDMVLRPGSGAQTGFKWLADKTDCLIVVPNQEGYCR